LELGYSNKILGLFTRILDDFYLDNENIDENRINCFDEMIRHWDDERIIKIINYIKEWNTNSKFAYVAQIILNGLIRIVKIEKITSLFKNGSADQNTVLGLIAYSERHFQRYDKIHEALYMMEFMNTQMSLLPQKKLTDQDAENVLGKSKVPVLFAPVEKKRKVSL
jgi:U3 small nucleolar RNA-associated protein 13